MKRILLAILALIICLCSFACKRPPEEPAAPTPLSEDEWRAAFAFENVRVDCTRQFAGEDPKVGEPRFGGDAYLLEGDSAVVTNATEYVIGEDGEPVQVKKDYTFENRAEIVLLFDFYEMHGEFALQEDGSYFAATSSMKNILWEGDSVKDVTVVFDGSRITKISYSYYAGTPEITQRQIFTFTFSQYGEIDLSTVNA